MFRRGGFTARAAGSSPSYRHVKEGHLVGQPPGHVGGIQGAGRGEFGLLALLMLLRETGNRQGCIPKSQPNSLGPLPPPSLPPW